jgi:hypothetical protein
MKKSEITNIFHFLGGIKISQVKDKEMRNALYAAHISLFHAAKQIEEDIQELQKKVFEGKENEVQKLQSLRAEFHNLDTSGADYGKKSKEVVDRINSECADTLKLEVEFNRAYNDIMSAEVKGGFKTLSRQKFLDSICDFGVDIKLDQLALLDPILKD